VASWRNAAIITEAVESFEPTASLALDESNDSEATNASQYSSYPVMDPTLSPESVNDLPLYEPIQVPLPPTQETWGWMTPSPLSLVFPAQPQNICLGRHRLDKIPTFRSAVHDANSLFPGISHLRLSIRHPTIELSYWTHTCHWGDIIVVPSRGKHCISHADIIGAIYDYFWTPIGRQEIFQLSLVERHMLFSTRYMRHKAGDVERRMDVLDGHLEFCEVKVVCTTPGGGVTAVLDVE